jgi:proteasome lid subunit RPN8/RPN11
MFNRAVSEAAQAHAIATYPEESCGLVVDGIYAPVANQISGTSGAGEAFSFDEALIVGLGARLQGVIHSHPDQFAVPSAADMRQQQAMALPWGILSVGRDPGVGEHAGEIITSAITWFGPGTPKQPLIGANGIGRGFIHGVQDCFSAILDWHRDRGINHPEWPRDWEWWLPQGEAPAEDLYRAHFEEMGCVAIDAPRPGAVFFACIGRDIAGAPNYRPNHGGVYLGNGTILHHRTTQKPLDPTRLSKREPIGILARATNMPLQWVVHREMTDALALTAV